MNLTVMSFNVQHCLNFLTKKIDYDCMADAIRRCGADVIGLNEMRDTGESPGYEPQVQFLAERLGYRYCYFARAIELRGKNPYGNALLSRYPIRAAKTVLIDDPDPRGYDGYYETRCVLCAEVEVGDEVLRVMVTHFGLNPDEAENAVKTVCAHLGEQRTVLMGDFNLCPDSPLLQPIYDRLFDTAERFPAPRLSFPSDVPRKKIDYIFTTRDLVVREADIPEIVASDHRPHIAVLAL